MADEAQQIRTIHWREVFPFTHLFRAFRIAVHPSKLLLALAALLLVYLGGRALDAAWMNHYKAKPSEFGYFAGARRGADTFDADMARIARIADYEAARAGAPSGGPGLAQRPGAQSVQRDLATLNRGIFISFFEYEVGRVNDVAQSVLANNWFGGGLTTVGVFPSIWAFLAVGPGILVANHPLYAVLFFAWFLLVWSLFGGAIARIAAVHVARDEKISVRQALRFSISKVLSFLFAPLIPLMIILAIGAVVAATGLLLLYIKWVGPVVMGLVFFLALLAGFIMTLVALGTIGGFNLMFPTVAVEGSDSFDAISRSFSYVFARPWRMLFYTAVAIAYGALTYLFVRLFIFVMLLSTHYFVGWFLPTNGQPNRYWNGPSDAVIWPAPSWDNLTYNVNYTGLKSSEAIAAGAVSFWVYLTIGLLGAFAISFYFSANTIIYYLMRREVDATELDDVYVEETEDEFGEPVATTTPGGATPSATPTAVSASTTTEGAAAGTTGDGGGARAYTVEGGSGTVAAGGTGETGNTAQAPGGGTANP
jgi:hypothetical protein